MKGILFRSFVDMAEDRFGLALVDLVLREVDPPSGAAYTSVGTYAHEELLALVQCLSGYVGSSRDELLFAYGRHLFGVFAEDYAGYFEGIRDGFDFVARVEGHIHAEVRKLHPDAELPHFATEATAEGMSVRYTSPRPFAELAHGLLDACFRYFGESVEIATTVTARGADFRISRTAGVR